MTPFNGFVNMQEDKELHVNPRDNAVARARLRGV